MGRGGAREGSGKKTSWPSGCRFAQTKLIRVPEYLSAQLLEIGKKLDAGEVIDFDTKSKVEQLDVQVSTLQKENEALKQQISSLKSKFTVESKPKRTQQKEDGIQLNLLNQRESPSLNELVTESKTVDNSFISAVTLENLAKRLKLGSTAIRDKLRSTKGKESEFSSWSKKKDPDNVAWEYRKEEKLFYPSVPKD